MGTECQRHISTNCGYVHARNKLIPEAERIASACHSATSKESGYHWTKVFVRALDELAAPLLRQQSSNGTNAAVASNKSKPFQGSEWLAIAMGAQARQQDNGEREQKAV